MSSSYPAVRRAFLAAPIRVDVPLGHQISVPLPTSAWPAPSYLGFACPATRTRGTPPVVSAPDRWWAVTAERPVLVAYAHTLHIPLSGPADPAPVSVATERQGDELEEDLRVAGELLDQVTPAFFAGTNVAARQREELRECLVAVLPRALLPWYRAAVPTFFRWLDESEAS
ncbi:hypothetical protein [Lentzea cavernae]|uniref:Uncharacterized protein n=1 Tax=Lentzea cavernae TaxID=2020703 RepID=A0ABQ3MFI6_9PSEU|nr:hypothetical protein [Lentzea cavernae]GHH42673.1 hypothetical protein GCM10017774_39420 [Lentzea cavernae]